MFSHRRLAPPSCPSWHPAYYYIAYTTIELFASSLTAKTKLKVRRGGWVVLHCLIWLACLPTKHR